MPVWTNQSVLKFAAGADPIATMEERARQVALDAIDRGWRGPPFDPIDLAKLLSIEVQPTADVLDARAITAANGKTKIEFNPTRPGGRVRFSIAHEIAHTFFADCAEKPRHRAGPATDRRDDWQLEMLCNIGAAEITMPAGSFPELQQSELDLEHLLELRKTFGVSTEALLVRVVKLANSPCAMFGTTTTGRTAQRRLDYAISSRSWCLPLKAGASLSANSIINEADAIGYTAKGKELWANEELFIQCVGLPPYAGSTQLRAACLAMPASGSAATSGGLLEVRGDALAPRGAGKKIIAHLVPDSTSAWGGRGFAGAVRARYPEVWREFRQQTIDLNQLRLGKAFLGRVSDDTEIVHMVAQHGIGPSSTPRIRYGALERCLLQLREAAERLGASVHMPRIGTGYAGGSWPLIKELIQEVLTRNGINVTVYALPN